MKQNKIYKMKKKNLVYGIRPILELLETAKEVDKILMQKGSKGDTIKHILDTAKSRNIPVQMVPVERLNRVTRANHQGLIAFISPIEYQDITQIIPNIFENGETPFIVVLDRITDVRNFGAICRSAECAGAHAIVIPQNNSAQINEDAIKTSAGAIHRIPICREFSLSRTLYFLKNSGLLLYGISEKSDETIYNADMKVPLALVMGNEGDGIANEYFKYFDKTIKIPMKGNIQSLNVSVAAGIGMFELVRQRMK